MRLMLKILVVLILMRHAAFGLGPHEVVVLVNERSPDSIEIAKAFVKLRRVPAENVIRLHVPKPAADSPSRISRDDFTKYIWLPAIKRIQELGIADHILALVYSVDFPIRIETIPPISITGITFLKNQLFDMRIVNDGKYSSPLFAGPSAPWEKGYYPQSFETYNEWLREDMPLPSMMLGYIKEGGNTKEEVLACLKTGAEADHTHPKGTVYFVKSDDIRSTCRHWQFPDAKNELRELGIKSVIVTNFPIDKLDVAGLMTGSVWVRPQQGNKYTPGCMAEHLTSAAAIFSGKGQAHLSRWISAGVTASAGTVSEPYSIWTKFPHARFYSHYASGCTMMESFYLSIRCPIQILLVGEPLSQPWAPEAKISIKGLESDKPVSGKLKIIADVMSDILHTYARCMFLVDGKTVQYGRSNILEFDTSTVKNGSHVIRVVSYETGFVRSQIFDEKTFVVKN